MHQNTTYEKKNLKGEQRIPAGIAYHDSAGPGCGSAVSVHDKKQDAYNADRYDITLSSSALGSPITIYMNDSLLFQGTPQSVMTLSVGRFQEESSLLIVDGTTNKVTTIELPNHSETIRLGKREDKFFREWSLQDGVNHFTLTVE